MSFRYTPISDITPYAAKSVQLPTYEEVEKLGNCSKQSPPNYHDDHHYDSIPQEDGEDALK